MNSNCDKLEVFENKIKIQCNGSVIETDHVYSAIPSYSLSKLLDNKHSLLKQKLDSIPFVNVAVVNLEYNGKLVQREGFGFLVPPCENLSILGIIYDTCSFPQVS